MKVLIKKLSIIIFLGFLVASCSSQKTPVNSKQYQNLLLRLDTAEEFIDVLNSFEIAQKGILKNKLSSNESKQAMTNALKNYDSALENFELSVKKLKKLS